MVMRMTIQTTRREPKTRTMSFSLPLDVAAAIDSIGEGSKSEAVAAALRKAWKLPEPEAPRPFE